MEEGMLENARHEMKFILPNVHFVNCEAFVRSLPLLFQKTHAPRQVNNIYFDTRYLDCLNDTIDGEAKRFKIRARWYGSFFEKTNYQMEIKSKINLLGYKSVFDLGQTKVNSVNLFSKSLADFCGKKLPPELRLKYLNFNTTLANSYHRDYYLSACKSLRLTIDKKIKALPLRYRNSFPRLTPIQQDVTIIEVKFEPRAFDIFCRLASQLPLRFSRFSKYEMGMHEDLTLKIKNIV